MVFHRFLLRGFEVWLTTRLLQSPIFHRIVGRVHQKIQHFRHGVPPEMGGQTQLEKNGPGFKQFVEYFKEELKDQMKGKPPNKS